MNAIVKDGTLAVANAVPAAPRGFKLKPAARREFVLQAIRERGRQAPAAPPKTS
jgi:hypothetical protein